MHRFYFFIYEASSMFHGIRWRNLSGSNNSILVISVNTFLKYFSGSNWLSLAVEDELPSLWVNAAIEGDPVLLWLMSKQGIGGLWRTLTVFSHTHHFLKRLIKWVYKKCRKPDNLNPPISYILQPTFTHETYLARKQRDFRALGRFVKNRGVTRWCHVLEKIQAI